MFVDIHGQVINDGALVTNGQLGGPFAGMVEGRKFDPNLLRPYLARHKDGSTRPAVTLVVNYKDDGKGNPVPVYKQFWTEDLARKGVFTPVWNATSLRKEDWIHIDRAIVRSTRQRLRAWADAESMVGMGGFDGMSKMTHEYEAMSDPGEAMVDMDGLSDGRNDAPLFKLRSVPLPITHSDFWFSRRRIEVSRNSSTPLDTTMSEAAARRVAEMIERTLIGTETGVQFGTQTTGVTQHDGLSKVYGYTNSPYKVAKTDLTTPDGTNPDSVAQDVIEMRETMYANGFYGPFMLYYSTPYDQFLDRPHFVGTFAQGLTTGTVKLRRYIEDIDGIQGMRRLDFLTSGYQMILVQMTSDVVQAINGMDVTTVQWESQGGLRQNFKVMAIKVPLIKAPYNGIAGLIHGTTS